MGKNIVICCDGTGNRGGKVRGTNVWRIYNAVDQHSKCPQQVTYYDDGVGTQDLRWIRLISGAFGWGLSQNIRQAYAFLCLNYCPGDKIFLFGFSRGAFTVRSLAGMVADVGLLKREALLKAGHSRTKSLKKLLHAHRSSFEGRLVKRGGARFRERRLKRSRKLGGYCCDDLIENVCIEFVGVWDTVDAVGVPFDEMKCIFESVSKTFFRMRACAVRE